MFHQLLLFSSTEVSNILSITQRNIQTILILVTHVPSVGNGTTTLIMTAMTATRLDWSEACEHTKPPCCHTSLLPLVQGPRWFVFDLPQCRNTPMPFTHRVHLTFPPPDNSRTYVNLPHDRTHSLAPGAWCQSGWWHLYITLPPQREWVKQLL